MNAFNVFAPLVMVVAGLVVLLAVRVELEIDVAELCGEDD